MKPTIKFGAVVALGSVLLLSGCNDNKQSVYGYTIDVTNLTTNQPLSPIAAVLHNSGYEGFALGSMASSDLERLAEAGDNTHFINSAKASSSVINAVSGSGIIAPGTAANITLQGKGSSPRLTLASMLVNTNDGFIGLESVDLSTLAINESLVVHARVYDAGTEANSETAATVPGPAGGGEGYNATRDDHDFIAVHAGVVSSDDGLATSVLTAAHRFDNPGARVVITRMQ